MTNQEMFDKVAKHLLSQGEKSQSHFRGCRYREGHLRCAIGCLIPDDKYELGMEGCSITNLVQDKAALALRAHEICQAAGINAGNLGLAINLLQVHDVMEPGDWRSGLRLVAILYCLNPRCLDQQQTEGDHVQRN